MKILLALDSSPTAMKEAVRFARERNASLTALFVLDSTWPDFIGHDWLSGSNARDSFLKYIAEEEKQSAEKTLEIFGKTLGDANLDAEVKVRTGNVVKEILDEVKKGYDLLIMPVPFQRGLEILRNPLSKILNRITEDARCSVYLVSEKQIL